MCLGYNTSKAAVIRMTHTLQKEMELDGFDDVIQIYALHPGGVLTAMGSCKLYDSAIIPKILTIFT